MSDKNLTAYEPDPTEGEGESMHDLLMQDLNKCYPKPDILPILLRDIEDRKQFGLDKYNMLLKANNGRNPLVDAYQEALDLAVYFRQYITEKGGPARIDIISWRGYANHLNFLFNLRSMIEAQEQEE